MGIFKNWIEGLDFDSDKAFSQKHKTQASNIGEALGFVKPLVKYSEGSFATLYYHPTKKNLLIKVTSHKSDIMNLVQAQKLNSNNIVKLFSWRGSQKVKELPALDSFAIIVELVSGLPMIYSTSEFYELSFNGRFEFASNWLSAGGHPRQHTILNKHNKNNELEHMNLSELFQTLYNAKKYHIDLSDFEDNIIDSVSRYVIIDMGY